MLAYSLSIFTCVLVTLSGEQARFAFPHLHVVQSPLQEHLISSLHALDTSRMVIQTGIHDCDSGSLDQPKSLGDGVI